MSGNLKKASEWLQMQRLPRESTTGEVSLVDIEEKVLERIATSDSTVISIERLPDGKMRVLSNSWDHERVFLRDQVLKVRNVDGRLHVARKTRHPDARHRGDL